MVLIMTCIVNDFLFRSDEKRSDKHQERRDSSSVQRKWSFSLKFSEIIV